LTDRLNALTAERDRTKSALERAKSAGGQPILIDPALLERFGRNMRDYFTSGSIPFRKAYQQSLIDVIEVDDDQIRIKGGGTCSNASSSPKDTPIPEGSQMSTKWRAIQNKIANSYIIEITFLIRIPLASLFCADTLMTGYPDQLRKELPSSPPL
jgi:hypothetical protein